MFQRKIAIIGHSGVGKSSAHLELLERGFTGAEMDKCLGTDRSPSFQKTMKWMISHKADFIIVSVHKEMLIEMAQEKGKRNNDELFSKLIFIYLFKSKERLEQSLRKSSAEARCREEGHIQAVLNGYHNMDILFRKIADYVIDTTYKDTSDVVDEIIWRWYGHASNPKKKVFSITPHR